MIRRGSDRDAAAVDAAAFGGHDRGDLADGVVKTTVGVDDDVVAFGGTGHHSVGGAEAALGASVQKLSYLPEAHTDFILAVIAEELGFVGVFAIIALYAGLAGRAFWVGLKCVEMKRHFAGYCAFGIALWMSLQSFVSIGVNLGLLPTKGLTLPLVSSGGSSVLLTCAALGVLYHLASGSF